MVGCTNVKEEADIKNIKVNLENMSKVKLSSIASNCEIIKLETNNECLISRIQKYEQFVNKLYLSDRVFQGIYIFNEDGKFIRSFNKQGKGEGEYRSLDDFLIDSNSSTIEILDKTRKKISIYDIHDFSLLKEIDIPFDFFHKFVKSDDSYYFQTNSASNIINGKRTNCDIVEYNFSSGKLKPIFDKVLSEGNNQHIQFQNIFYANSKNEIFVSLGWDETQYILNSDHVEEISKIDPCGYGIPESIVNGKYDDKIKFLKSKDIKDKIGFFKLLSQEDDEFLYTYTKFAPMENNFFFYQNGGKSVIHADYFENDMLPFPKRIDQLFKIYDRELISVYYPVDYAEDKEFLEYFKLSMEDNPIILKAKLR